MPRLYSWPTPFAWLWRLVVSFVAAGSSPKTRKRLPPTIHGAIRERTLEVVLMHAHGKLRWFHGQENSVGLRPGILSTQQAAREVLAIPFPLSKMRLDMTAKTIASRCVSFRELERLAGRLRLICLTTKITRECLPPLWCAMQPNCASLVSASHMHEDMKTVRYMPSMRSSSILTKARPGS